MSEEEFRRALRTLREIPYREDFETKLCALYMLVSETQRAEMRAGYKVDRLGETMPWRNPSDFARSDLTREERARQSLILMSVEDGGDDYRDDLMGIAWCYHNLLVRGVDADGFLRQVVTMSAPKVGELILNFVDRPSVGKCLQAFGLRVVQAADGPIVEYTPGGTTVTTCP